MELKDRKCVPCDIGTPPMEESNVKKYLLELDSWKLDNNKIKKTFKFKNFKEALKFTNQIGELAEREGHHPDIYLSWGKVEAEIFTHKINGLTESDFVLAAKIDDLFNNFS